MGPPLGIDLVTHCTLSECSTKELRLIALAECTTLTWPPITNGDRSQIKHAPHGQLHHCATVPPSPGHRSPMGTDLRSSTHHMGDYTTELQYRRHLATDHQWGPISDQARTTWAITPLSYSTALTWPPITNGDRSQIKHAPHGQLHH